MLEGKTVNKAGNVVDDRGMIFGKLTEGDLHSLIGHRVAKDGNLWSDEGKPQFLDFTSAS